MSAAREIFDYLCLRSPGAPRGDVAIGFGHFDLRIPRVCGDLFRGGRVGRVIFTGGVGGGTADLGQPEARAFLGALRRSHPGLPEAAIFVEDASTNTSENVRFTARGLEVAWPDFRFGDGIRSAVLVASPYRMRRVMLTCKKLIPAVECVCFPPETTFEEEGRLFSGKGQDLEVLLAGEIDRIVDYGARGYIEVEAVPDGILRARGMLGRMA